MTNNLIKADIIEARINKIIFDIHEDTQKLYQQSRSEIKHSNIIDQLGRANQNKMFINTLEKMKEELRAFYE